MSKLDQLRAQREAWASGKPKVVTEIPVTLNPLIKSNAGIKSNTDLAKLDAHVVTAAELREAPPLTAKQLAKAVHSEGGVPLKRGRPAKPDGVTKDRAAYMRARRAKKP